MLNWDEFTNSVNFNRTTPFCLLTEVWFSAKIFVCVDYKRNFRVRKLGGNTIKTHSIDLTEACPGGTWKKDGNRDLLRVICLSVNHSFTLGYKDITPSGPDFLFGIGFEMSRVNCSISKKENNYAGSVPKYSSQH